jgi:hypothetical protein
MFCLRLSPQQARVSRALLHLMLLTSFLFPAVLQADELRVAVASNLKDSTAARVFVAFMQNDNRRQFIHAQGYDLP